MQPALSGRNRRHGGVKFAPLRAKETPTFASAARDLMGELILRMADGTHIAVPSSLDSITTYVILEQEKWFEKEAAFLARVLKPGMTAIDIGANLGVYSLPMTRLVAPGEVFAYEPASEPRTLLARAKELNAAANLHLLPLALSDRAREGTLVLGASSELNSLEGTARVSRGRRGSGERQRR